MHTSLPAHSVRSIVTQSTHITRHNRPFIDNRNDAEQGRRRKNKTKTKKTKQKLKKNGEKKKKKKKKTGGRNDKRKKTTPRHTHPVASMPGVAASLPAAPGAIVADRMREGVPPPPCREGRARFTSPTRDPGSAIYYYY
jgi:hypothetical protein